MKRLVTVLMLSSCVAAPAWAQSTPTGRLSFSLGSGFGEGSAVVLVGGSAGFQVARRLGVEFEASFLPNLNLEDLSYQPGPLPLSTGLPPDIVIPGFPFVVPPIRFERDARLVTFTSNVVGEFTPAKKMRLYVLGGGGVASLRERVRYSITAFDPILQSVGGINAFPIVFPSRIIGRDETDLVLTVGGGADFEVWPRFAIALDSRYVQIFAQREDLHLARVGTRFSYRF